MSPTPKPLSITLHLHRQRVGEPETGFLRAWVVADGNRGRNLLFNRHLTGPDYAKQLAARELARSLPVGQAVAITWTEDV